MFDSTHRVEQQVKIISPIMDQSIPRVTAGHLTKIFARGGGGRAFDLKIN